VTLLLTKYYSGDIVKKNKMGGTCSMYGGQERWVQGFGGGKVRGRDHLEDLGVDRKIVLKWIFKKWDGEHGLDFSGSGWGQVAGAGECGNEHSGSIKCEEILDQLRTC
jgi:hypothetical protein